MKPSAVREILKLTQGQSIISFAGGLPAEELFPAQAVKEAFERVFEQGNRSFQYGLTEGYIPLREAIAARMLKKQMEVTIDEMLLTTGSQQVIDLLTRVYLDSGQVVLVENPTYLAALQVFAEREARVIPVDCDDDGMQPDDLEHKIRTYQPRLIYVIPTFSNPTGKAWSLERRKKLIELSKKYNVLILEDDPYGDLQYNAESPYPTIFSLDGDREERNVIYTSTFSKTVVPALRTGWAIGDKRVIQMMAYAKQASDLHSSSMDQQALHQLLTHFNLDQHIEEIRREYKARMRLMVDLLKAQQWKDVTWTEPEGGMFMWMKLPAYIDSDELLKTAVQQGVAFVPGSSFYAATPEKNTLRLNFTHTNRENTVIGVERLGKALEIYHNLTV